MREFGSGDAQRVQPIIAGVIVSAVVLVNLRNERFDS
jgi:hypothetical protein